MPGGLTVEGMISLGVVLVALWLGLWLATRAIRRLARRMEGEEEIPYPHLSVYFGEASKPFAVEVSEQLARREPLRGEPSGRPR